LAKDDLKVFVTDTLISAGDVEPVSRQ